MPTFTFEHIVKSGRPHEEAVKRFIEAFSKILDADLRMLPRLTKVYGVRSLNREWKASLLPLRRSARGAVRKSLNREWKELSGLRARRGGTFWEESQ